MVFTSVIIFGVIKETQNIHIWGVEGHEGVFEVIQPRMWSLMSPYEFNNYLSFKKGVVIWKKIKNKIQQPHRGSQPVNYL